MIPVQDTAQAEATTTLAELLVRYRDEISSTKRGGDIKAIRVNCMLRHPFSKTPLVNISSAVLNQYKNDRLRQDWS